MFGIGSGLFILRRVERAPIRLDPTVHPYSPMFITDKHAGYAMGRYGLAGPLPRGGQAMSHQKNRREAAWKSRKQEQHPHGKIKSLKELSNESENR